MEWTDRIGRRIKLRDLHFLLAVAKSGSMGKAAAELSVSQPVISKAISSLEHALGVRLLDRSPQGAEPTSYGRALLECGAAVFDDLRQGVKQLEFISDPTSGELRIGCTLRADSGFVGEVIDRFSLQYPRVKLHVVLANQVPLRDRELRQRNIELAIGPTDGSLSQQDLETDDLFNDRQIIVAGMESKWAGRRKIALQDLIGEPWVLPPPESGIGSAILKSFQAAGLKAPEAQIVTHSVALCQRLVATGRYLSMFPMSVVRISKHCPLKPLPVASPEILRPIGIITLKNRTISPMAHVFIKCAHDLVKRYAGWQ
jgi:DNA-binding transcriptional LysR family regulator